MKQSLTPKCRSHLFLSPHQTSCHGKKENLSISKGTLADLTSVLIGFAVSRNIVTTQLRS